MNSFLRKTIPLFAVAALLATGCPSNGSTSTSNAGTKDLDTGSGAAVARGAGSSDAAKTSAWHGTHSFGWSAGGSAGGGIVAVSTYKVTVSGPATRPDVVVYAEATQAMPVTYRAHGEPKSATELDVVLDACRSDGETECSRNKVGDVLVTLVSGNPAKMRFGKLRAPNETTKELVADKVATP